MQNHGGSVAQKRAKCVPIPPISASARKSGQEGATTGPAHWFAICENPRTQTLPRPRTQIRKSTPVRRGVAPAFANQGTKTTKPNNPRQLRSKAVGFMAHWPVASTGASRRWIGGFERLCLDGGRIKTPAWFAQRTSRAQLPGSVSVSAAATSVLGNPVFKTRRNGHFHESGTYYWPDPDILSPRAPAAAAHAD